MFGTYETIRIYCDENEKTTAAHKKWELATLNHSAGTIGGVIAKIITFPLETIRRRMQFMNSKHLEKFSRHSSVYGSYKGYGFARIGLQIFKTRRCEFALQRYSGGPFQDNTHHFCEFLGV